MDEGHGYVREEELQRAEETEEMLLNILQEKEKAIAYTEQLIADNQEETAKICTSLTWKFKGPIGKVFGAAYGGEHNERT